MNISEYVSLPLGSLVRRSSEEENYYLRQYVQMPAALKRLVTSAATGAYIRGLAKSYQLLSGEAYRLAFLVLQTAVGEIKLSALAERLASDLVLNSEQARSMSQEIRQDLFNPIIKELEEYWTNQKKEGPGRAAQTRATEGGAKNVLNLKKENKPPVPPWR